MPGERPEVLEVKEVRKTFGNFRALDGVDLTVEQSEVHALVGPNGSGKSTLVKILAGYHEPDRGSQIRWPGPGGDAHGASSGHRGVRFVHQGLGLVNELNAIENVVLGQGYKRRGPGVIDWPWHRAATRQALAGLGLSLDIDLPAGELTALERTAVAIARAIEGWDAENGLLVLDEPTVALTTNEVASLFGIVRAVCARGAGAIFISHRLDEVFAIADRITVLRGGRVVASGPAGETSIPEVVAHMSGELAPRVIANPAAATSTRPVLRLDGVSARGLAPTTLDVHAGEIVGVAGLTGAGREVLPYVIYGVIPPTSGTVRRTDPDLVVRDIKSARAGGISLLPGDRDRLAAFSEFDVAENITITTLGRHTTRGRVARASERSRARRWISTLSIRPPSLDAPMWSLSGGNQQKVAMARCLESDPRVVVMDDPTQGVDVGVRHAMHELIRARARDGVAFVVSGSDAEELADLATRVMVLRADLDPVELRGTDITVGAIHDAMNETVLPTPHAEAEAVTS